MIFKTLGDPQAPAVLFFHAMGVTGGSSEPVAQHLQDKYFCILPTYMNRTEQGGTNSITGAIGKAGADFKRAFTPDSYRRFLEAAGYTDARYTLCSGRVPCAVAVLRKGGCPSDKKYPEVQGSGQKGMDAK